MSINVLSELYHIENSNTKGLSVDPDEAAQMDLCCLQINP